MHDATAILTTLPPSVSTVYITHLDRRITALPSLAVTLNRCGTDRVYCNLPRRVSPSDEQGKGREERVTQKLPADILPRPAKPAQTRAVRRLNISGINGAEVSPIEVKSSCHNSVASLQ